MRENPCTVRGGHRETHPLRGGKSAPGVYVTQGQLEAELAEAEREAARSEILGIIEENPALARGAQEV